MIVSFFCLFLLLYAIKKYNNGHKVTSTYIFILFACSGFGFFHDEWLTGLPINKYYDFSLLYILYIIIRRKFNFSLTNDIQKFFVWLLLYCTFVFMLTVVLNLEILSYSFKVYRLYFYFLSFLVFQGLSKQQLRKLVYLVCISTVIAAVVYVTQPLHKLPLLNRMVNFDNISLDGNDHVRYRNIPELLYFITCFVLVTFKFSNIRSVVLIGICGMSIVLSQHRAVMIAFVAVIGIYLLISRQMGKILQYSVMGLVGFALVGSMITSRFNEEKGKEGTTTVEDIRNVLTMDFRAAALSGYDDEGGTFAFRVLLFVERFDYYTQHPQYMLTGIGMRHEDSPRTKKDFNFVLGSKKLNKETGIWEAQQINSADLVWFSPFMRMGIIGLFLYILITCRMAYYFYAHKNCGIVTMSAFLYYVFLIIISMKNDMLFANQQLALLFLLIELIEKTNIKDTEECHDFLDFNILNLKEKNKSKVVR